MNELMKTMKETATYLSRRHPAIVCSVEVLKFCCVDLDCVGGGLTGFSKWQMRNGKEFWTRDEMVVKGIPMVEFARDITW